MILFQRLRQLILRQGVARSGVKYWQDRAAKCGRRAVFNLRHTDAELDSVTEIQRRKIYPYFTGLLEGNERVVLDFGCGTGRFTVDLANLVGGRAIGVDPVKALLDLAPRSENVEYKQMKEGSIRLPDKSVDAVWVCLVLGGIRGRPLKRTVSEIQRVLKSGGLLFLVENTEGLRDHEHWAYRKFNEYRSMLPYVTLNHLHDYFDLGERISIMAGRKLQ